MNENLLPHQRRVRLFLLCRCSRRLLIVTTVGEVTDRVSKSGWKLAPMMGADYDVCPDYQSEERVA